MGNGGTYTEHLADIRAFMERMDERQQAMQDDIREVKDVVSSNAARIAQHDTQLAVLSTRQRLILAVGGSVGLGALSYVAKLILA